MAVFPSGEVVKNLPANAGDTRDTDSIPGSGNGNHSNILAGTLHGQRTDRRTWRVYSPWGCKESDTNEHTQHTG